MIENAWEIVFAEDGVALRFLQANSATELMDTAIGIIKKFAGLFGTSTVHLSQGFAQAMQPMRMRFSAFYLNSHTSQFRAVVSVSDNKVIDVDPWIRGGRLTYARDLAEQLRSGEVLLAMYGMHYLDLVFVPHHTVLLYDGNPGFRPAIHAEVYYLEKLCKLIACFRVVSDYQCGDYLGHYLS